MVWKENRENAYCEITPAILALKEQWEKKNYIDPKLYKEYNVKRGLRDEDGRGVLTGLTRVGEIQSYSVTEGEHIVPQDGMLYYRGIDCRELVKGSEGRRFAFEETAYLLLFGELPTAAQLEAFCQQLASYRTLPTNFFRDVIMKAPPRDLMNTMQRGILTLFCYDDKPNDIGLENVLRQCLQLMSNMPVLAIYAYQAWRFSQGESLFIHVPKPELSTAENFLRMLREDCSYTDLEARTLDVALILHADNGGGNNSTFTNHVVTSSGTDTYSAIAAGSSLRAASIFRIQVTPDCCWPSSAGSSSTPGPECLTTFSSMPIAFFSSSPGLGSFFRSESDWPEGFLCGLMLITLRNWRSARDRW